MTDAPDPLPPGYKIGRYVVESELLPARFGRVYRALDPTLGRTVAINVLAPGSGPDFKAMFFDSFRRAYERCRREHGEALASIPLLDLCDIDGVIAAVVAYVEGRGAALDIADA